MDAESAASSGDHCVFSSGSYATYLAKFFVGLLCNFFPSI